MQSSTDLRRMHITESCPRAAFFDRIFTHSISDLAFSPQCAITLCWISDTAYAGEISSIMSPALGKGEL